MFRKETTIIICWCSKIKCLILKLSLMAQHDLDLRIPTWMVILTHTRCQLARESADIWERSSTRDVEMGYCVPFLYARLKNGRIMPWQCLVWKTDVLCRGNVWFEKRTYYAVAMSGLKNGRIMPWQCLSVRPSEFSGLLFNMLWDIIFKLSIYIQLVARHVEFEFHHIWVNLT